MPLDGDYLTPPQAGRRLRMKAETLIILIKSGELRASNVATRLSGRPRYRIAASDLADWLERRAAAAVAPPVVRPRKQRPARPAGWVSYFGTEPTDDVMEGAPR